MAKKTKHTSMGVALLSAPTLHVYEGVVTKVSSSSVTIRTRATPLSAKTHEVTFDLSKVAFHSDEGPGGMVGVHTHQLAYGVSGEFDADNGTVTLSNGRVVTFLPNTATSITYEAVADNDKPLSNEGKHIARLTARLVKQMERQSNKTDKPKKGKKGKKDKAEKADKPKKGKKAKADKPKKKKKKGGLGRVL